MGPENKGGCDFFFNCWLGFTPCKAEQPLQEAYGVTRKRKTKILKHTGNLFKKNLYTVKRCLLILNLKPFRS